MVVDGLPQSTQEPPRAGGDPQAEGAAGLSGRTLGWRQMLHHPAIRIVIAALVIISSVALAQSGLRTLREFLPLPVYYGLFAGGSLAVILASYCAYVHLVEVRTPDEVMATGAVGELAGGLLIGTGLVAAIVGSLWLVGAYGVIDIALSMAMAGALATDLAGGLVEEILFRAVIFRIGRELVGTRWALLLSALLFGLVHAGTLITFAVACLGGLLFGAAYMLTGRVWMAAGIHIAWDFMQDGILGVGASQASLVRSRVTGPVALTGGATGMEGSLIALVVVGLAAAALLTYALRHERVAPRPARGPRVRTAA